MSQDGKAPENSRAVRTGPRYPILPGVRSLAPAPRKSRHGPGRRVIFPNDGTDRLQERHDKPGFPTAPQIPLLSAFSPDEQTARDFRIADSGIHIFIRRIRLTLIYSILPHTALA